MDYQTLENMQLKEGQIIKIKPKNQEPRNAIFNSYNLDKGILRYTSLNKNPKQISVFIKDAEIV